MTGSNIEELREIERKALAEAEKHLATIQAWADEGEQGAINYLASLDKKLATTNYKISAATQHLVNMLAII